MRILFAAAREQSYARNEVLLRALRTFAEVDVFAPEEPPSSLVRASVRASRAAWSALARQRYDLIVAGFYGYLVAQALLPRTRTPLLLDAFVSNYDTLVEDRGTLQRGSLGAAAARLLDRNTCARAHRILLDTHAHADYFVQNVVVDADKIDVLPVGCSEALYFPQPESPATERVLRVLYYCTYLPLHGVEVVLHAAAELRDLPLEFHLIGDGPRRANAVAFAAAAGLEQVTFAPAVPPHRLPAELARAQICLGGHFGPGEKAQRTIPGKIYQMLACQRPVIAGDSAANRELLDDGASALLVPAQDPGALAAALRRLYGEPELRRTLAAGGRAAYEEHASEAVIAARLKQVIMQMTTRMGA